MLHNIKHILVIFVLLNFVSYGQESKLLWQKTIGGSGDDFINAIAKDIEGNIFVLGTVQASTNHDLYIARMDESGETLWKQTIGGNRDEHGVDIIVSSSQEIIVLASSNSNTGMMTGNKGREDIYLFRFSQSGELLQMNSYGGKTSDIPSHLTEMDNGNLIITGYSQSDDGDFTENQGQYDMFVFEVDITGTIVWQKSVGGEDEDIAIKTIPLYDGTFLMLGHSATYNGVFADNSGDFDIVLVHLNASGNVLWQRSYGGFYSDLASDMILLPNDNILVAGSTFSSGNDISNNAGGSDIWLFEIDPTTKIVWEDTYGSTGNETVSALLPSENGYLLLGTTASDYVMDEANHGGQDFWLYEIGHDKSILHHSLFGASGFEAGNAMLVSDDGSLLLGGSTNSSDGIVQGALGKKDGWLLKVERYFSETGIQRAVIHPNPTENVIYINEMGSNSTIRVMNQSGQLIEEQECDNIFAKVMDLSNYPSGMYILSISSDRGEETHRIMKN